MGRPELFPQGREPLDLGGISISDETPRGEGWLNRLRKLIGTCCGWIGRFLVLIIAIAVGIGFIVDTIMSIHDKDVSYVCFHVTTR